MDMVAEVLIPPDAISRDFLFEIKAVNQSG